MNKSEDVSGTEAGSPDVLVIGAGPAGSAVATLLARKGWKVTLLEKDQHPRFHIGESLLPQGIPVLERLGVLEQVRQCSVLKLGADFPNDDGTYSVFDFSKSLREQPHYAFQVKRADFDKILFDNAVGTGVDAHENTRVTAVDFAEDGAIRVQADKQEWRPRYLIDASGRDTFLANKLKLKQKNDKHASAAVFSHYEGVEIREGRDAGNVSIYRHPHGWLWLIPLSGGVTSIGAVCYPEYLKQRSGTLEEFLLQTCETAPELKSRMANAKRVADVHATGNYAYECKRMHGRHWTLLGDAYSFVDPMFSSGVFLALHGAEKCAETVDASLRDPECEAHMQRKFEKHFETGLDEFKWFIYRFTSPTMKHLFSNRRDVLGVERAVVSMLSGDVFDNAEVIRRRLRIFRLIYSITSLGMGRKSLSNWRTRRRQVAIETRDETMGNPSQ